MAQSSFIYRKTHASYQTLLPTFRLAGLLTVEFARELRVYYQCTALGVYRLAILVKAVLLYVMANETSVKTVQAKTPRVNITLQANKRFREGQEVG